MTDFEHCVLSILLTVCVMYKIEELETNSKINNIRDLYRDINDMKKGYQPRTRIVKDEKGDLVADSHSNYGEVEELFLPDIECT